MHVNAGLDKLVKINYKDERQSKTIIFLEKKSIEPKGPIKFKIQLNEEQKGAKSKILANTITLLAGAAGSGKTLLACQIALEKLFMREIR
jgi:predicted ribonuclease YlaK